MCRASRPDTPACTCSSAGVKRGRRSGGDRLTNLQGLGLPPLVLHGLVATAASATLTSATQRNTDAGDHGLVRVMTGWEHPLLSRDPNGANSRRPRVARPRREIESLCDGWTHAGGSLRRNRPRAVV